MEGFSFFKQCVHKKFFKMWLNFLQRNWSNPASSSPLGAKPLVDWKAQTFASISSKNPSYLFSIFFLLYETLCGCGNILYSYSKLKQDKGGLITLQKLDVEYTWINIQKNLHLSSNSSQKFTLFLYSVAYGRTFWIIEQLLLRFTLRISSKSYLNFFLSVAKDLANHWTDMVLLYNGASYISIEGF